MSFWEKFKEFDKMMSEPAIEIRTEKRIAILGDDSEVRELIEENKKLKKIIKKLLEQGITVENKKNKIIDINKKLLE